MNEPSLLDYLKSKLNPWQKDKVEIPTASLSESEPVAGSPQPAPVKLSLFAFAKLPWRSLSALGLALIAQRLLEPPVSSFGLPIGF